MELKLEVVLSSSIKRKKPWPRFCWLGQEKESVFLLDDKRISEINMVTGRTKKRTPKLHPLLTRVVTMASSDNGLWLCGLLVSGELFLWNRDKDLLKTAASALDVVKIITAVQGNATQLSLHVSGDGTRVLLVVKTGQVFLWECMDVKYLMGIRDGTVKGRWAHILPLEDTITPSSQDKEASHHTIFIKKETMGDACLSAFVFTSGKMLIITCLKIQWKECHVRMGPVGYSVRWATKTYSMSRLTPPCQPVRSRGALVPAFSPDGQLLAIVLNQRQPSATQVLFVSTQNFVSVSSSLGGCGSKKMEIPSKYIRSYWVGSVSWSPNSLFLSCVLKRGSLLMLARLGGLLTLTSSGCNIDFGPAHFLPLHPLVTFRPTVSAGKEEASLSTSGLSVQDVLRQRYSVTWHPRLLYLIVSDGYMATVMRVQDSLSPTVLLKTLLNDARKVIENTSQILDKSQIHLKGWLESVSGLNLDSSLEMPNHNVTCGPHTTDSVISETPDGPTLPLFLQDQGTLGGTKELLEQVQTFFEDDSDLDGPPAGSHMEDGGHLDFASMFDTLHAMETHTDAADFENDFVKTERKTYLLQCELAKIQSKLLTAWAFGMSLGNIVEHRTHLLKHTSCIVVQLAALLHLIPASIVQEKKNTSVSTSLLDLVKALLTFLPWDSTQSDVPCCVGLMVDLCTRLVHMLLSPMPESYQTGHYHLSSQTLSTAMFILQLVSDSLDHTYTLQQRTLWSFCSQPPQLWSSDVHHVPLLQNEREEKLSSLHQAQPFPQRPSSRLFGVWQWMYKISQQYMEKLKTFKGCDGWEDEQQHLSVIMSQVQTALQATGEKLEEGPTLLSYPGEHLFLCGLYPKSADAWWSQICEESNKGCERSVFQQTRLCLALLYSLLSQYHLREAQEFGDHMAFLVLHSAGHQKDNMTCITADSPPCPSLLTNIHSDAACAVIQTLGRFMASYFTNQPLYILPPHNVAVLPPLHLPHASSVGRLVPLCQQEVSRAVRQQHLSEVWTVEYAQDLLLLGGLLPETVWLAYHLGDWKTAVSLSLAYTSYCTDHFDFTRLKMRELHLPTDLAPESIFQAELECHLGNVSASQEHRDKDDQKRFTDPVEGEDWDLLHASVQEVLKASVMARVNVMSSPLSSLLDTVKGLCSGLTMLVPSALYLPSPPLYCPQPSPNTQDPVGTAGQFAELVSRHKVSGVLQRLLLLLRSAHCCHPAAQWYISHLRHARHVLYKIKKKYSYPSAAEEEKTFPECLMKFVTCSGVFRRGPKKDGHLDPDTIQTIICFRELCGLCWMLHVRDQLSISCRKYQAARQNCRDEQASSDSEVRSTRVDAVHWACRFLPFSRFLNAEEILQDIILSLVSELPPISLVAETLVKAFPEEEESVRVPLREKYNSLVQQLGQCNVLEDKKQEVKELMMILIQDKRRQRRKHLGRLQRHLAPPVLHLWAKDEEEEDRGSKNGMAMPRQLSLGTSVSTSTLTDCGLPPLCSDGEAISFEQLCTPMTSKKSKKANNRKNAKKTAVRTESVIQEETHTDHSKGNEQHSLPVVGTWEFELEDEEYLNFLELFLSYVLEKDGVDGGNSSKDLPLLKSYCSQLRERELHSLAFDVLRTVHCRQRDGRKHGSSDPPVFRAGCCYKPIKQETRSEPQTSSVWSEASMSKTSLSINSLAGLRSGRQNGLFGLQQQKSVPLVQRTKVGHSGSLTSPIQSAFVTEKPKEKSMFGSLTLVEAVTELQQGLDPKLEAQFPELGRLLEWMVRWSDKRVLLGHHGKRKKERGEGVGVTNEEGVVIRVKASAPAILTSLSLLECRYTALLGTDCQSTRIQNSETQWVVPPVLQPVADSSTARESSVDTGYPGSANTPLTGPDHNLQQELSIGSTDTDEPDKLTFPRLTLPNNPDQLARVAQMRRSYSQPLSLHDFDVTPEKEGKSNESDELEVSSSVTHGNISTPETSLKLADLDYSENAEEMPSSISLHARSLQASPHPELQAHSSVQHEASVHADLPPSTGVLLPNTPVDQQSSPAGAATAVPLAPNQPLLTETSPVRQRLGEDLIRLVTNINYMSLMEVLGASFSNLQLAQQRSSFVQSYMNSSLPNVPVSSATNVIPQPHALPVQATTSVTPQTQACVQSSGSNNPQSIQHTCMFSDQPAVQSPKKTSLRCGQNHTTSALLPAPSAEGVNYQGMRPLSVQPESPGIQFSESRKMIPPSQGLLTTTDISHAVTTAPVVLPLTSSIQNDPAPQLLGRKLLQLYCPPFPQQSDLHNPASQVPQMLHTKNGATLESHQHKPIHSHQTASRRAEEEEIRGTSVPRGQSSSKHLHDLTARACQPQILTSEGSQRQRFTIFPAVLPSHIPAPAQSLHLLHIQPVPQCHGTLPKLPVPPSSSQSTFIPASMAQMPLIKLLHIESGPKMILPLAAPSTQRTRLISTEDLTSSVIRRQNTEDARMQLLHVDPRAESTRMAFSTNSSKRQKRREEKTVQGRKPEVSFRPNESIIPAQEQTDEPENKDPAAAEQNSPGQDITIQLGSSDTWMTGQRLLDRVGSSSAELHAFASTSKRPPQCHDAFTNTDPACPTTLVDKAVSASVTASGFESQCSGIFRDINEYPVQDPEKTPKETQNIMDLGVRQFISVLDLEDQVQNQALPSYVNTGILDSIRPDSQTSAQLHVLATSVIRNAAADPQPLVTNDIPEESPSLSHVESSRDAEEVIPQAESLDSEICQAIKNHSVGPHRASSSASFSSRLSEIDAKLIELQQIADYLEKDFSNSRMLVNTIENLPPALVSDVKSHTSVKKTVRLSVPHDAWAPQPHILTGPNVSEEEEEYQEDVAPKFKPSSHYSTYSSHSHRVAVQTLSNKKDVLNDASGMSGADENLGQTGLSDTLEILDELVKEGYLSPTDLDFSPQTAHHSSSLDQQHSSWMSQTRVLPEDERRELRIWMRRKQRERLAVYQKHRESLRERERKPFATFGTMKSTNRNQATREEKEKFKLLEQYNQRTNEACSLVSDFPTSPSILRSSSQTEDAPMPSTIRSTSALASGSAHRSHSVLATHKRSLTIQSGQTQPAEAQRWPSREHHRRLGLHRPVTALPRDRLSQLTRRGMVTDTKSHHKLHIATQNEGKHAGYQRGVGLNEASSGLIQRSQSTRVIQRKQTQGQLKKEDKLWEPTSEMSSLLDLDESTRVLTGLLDIQDDGLRAGVSGMDLLDHLCESSSSSLSKIDWAAIERIVAAEED